MHLNSKLLFEKYAKPLFKNHMRVLEIGPNQHPSAYKQIVDNSTINWETIDIFKSDKLTYIAENEYKFPIADNTFDIVVSGQVIEHVKKIWVWIKELSRVCKVGGYVVTVNPVSWPYHEAPVDCWRIYPEGMKALYEEGNLTVQLSVAETLEVDVSRYIVPEHSQFFGSSNIGFRETLIKRLRGSSVLVPGSSYEPNYQGETGYKSLISKFLGIPSSCSLDNITIGVKES